MLDQVAGEDDMNVRHNGDDVVVGMAATEMGQLDASAAQLERDAVAEGLDRGRDLSLGVLVGDLGHSRGQRELRGPAVGPQTGGALLVAP